MKKILSLLVAVLMIVAMFAACGGSDDQKAPAADDAAKDPVIEDVKEAKSYTVNIHIRASEDADDTYSIDGYEFDADPDSENANFTYDSVLAVIDSYMYMEENVEIEFDDNGKLVKIGTLEADITQLWLCKKASAPKGVGDAEPIDGNIDSYNEIANGDTLVIYLS